MADKEGNEKVPKKPSGDFWQRYKFYIIGGVAVLGILVFFFVRQSNQNAASSSTTGSTTAPNQSTLSALNGIDPSTGIPYADEFGMLNGAQSAGTYQPPAPVAGPSTTNYYYGSGQGPSVPAANFGNEQLVGSGYNIAGGQGSSVQANGQTFSWLTPASAASAVSSGKEIFYQPTQGNFVPTVPGSQFGQGTPLYTAA